MKKQFVLEAKFARGWEQPFTVYAFGETAEHAISSVEEQCARSGQYLSMCKLNQEKTDLLREKEKKYNKLKWYQKLFCMPRLVPVILIALIALSCTKTHTPRFNPDASIQYTLTDSLRLSATAYGQELTFVWHVNDVRYTGQKVSVAAANRYYVQLSVLAKEGSVSEYLTIVK